MSLWIFPSPCRYSKPSRSSLQMMAMCASEKGPGLSCTYVEGQPSHLVGIVQEGNPVIAYQVQA